MYQNCIPKSENDNVKLKPTSRKAKHETRPTSYHQETMDTRELEKEYANAELKFWRTQQFELSLELYTECVLDKNLWCV